jgi:hypothetical protein
MLPTAQEGPADYGRQFHNERATPAIPWRPLAVVISAFAIDLSRRLRLDNRRASNGDQVSRVAALAMKRGKSVDFTGYWQRHIAD